MDKELDYDKPKNGTGKKPELARAGTYIFLTFWGARWCCFRFTEMHFRPP